MLLLVEDLSKFKQQEPMIRNDPLSSKKNSKSVRLKSQIVKSAENPSLSWAGVDWILQSIKCLSCITHIFMDDELKN